MNSFKSLPRDPWMLIALVALGATQVQAQSPATGPEESKLQISAGLNRTTNSLFKGLLIQSRTDPTIDIEYERGPYIASMQNGLGYKLVSTDALSLGISANYMPGRHEVYDTRYRGMGNVSGTVSAFGYFEWRPVKDVVTVYGNLARSLKSANGMVGNLGGTLGFPVVGQLNGFVDVYMTWGSSAFNQTFYGVNTTQAASSGYAVYNATSGTISTTPTVGLVYEYSKQWSVLGYAGRNKMSSGLSASPLVAKPSQPVAALLVTRNF